jgi:drug/metabolite transporter (DMT)-like permease
VAYRFGIASLALVAYAALSGRSLTVPRGGLPFIGLQGVLMFSLNYYLVYYASAYVTTGLLAVLFSTIVMSNAVLERLFFRSPWDARLAAASVMGTMGIAMVFWPEVSRLSLGDDAILGVLLGLGSMFCASLGNMAAAKNLRGDTPVIAVNAYAMGFAATLSVLVAASLGRDFAFSFEPAYLLSLAHLSLLGSAVAFGCYLTLIRNIGPSRASYTGVLIPIVALGISTWLEGYVWTTLATIGILLTLMGNLLILRKRQRQETRGRNP